MQITHQSRLALALEITRHVLRTIEAESPSRVPDMTFTVEYVGSDGVARMQRWGLELGTEDEGALQEDQAKVDEWAQRLVAIAQDYDACEWCDSLDACWAEKLVEDTSLISGDELHGLEWLVEVNKALAIEGTEPVEVTRHPKG